MSLRYVLRYGRGERMILALMLLATFSVVVFALILWFVRRETGPPDPSRDDYERRIARLRAIVARDDGPEALAPDEFVRRLETLQIRRGVEVVSLRGRVLSVAPPAEDGRVRLELGDRRGRPVPCWFEPGAVLDPSFVVEGREVTVRGVAERFGELAGLHLCRLLRD